MTACLNHSLNGTIVVVIDVSTLLLDSTERKSQVRDWWYDGKDNRKRVFVNQSFKKHFFFLSFTISRILNPNVLCLDWNVSRSQLLSTQEVIDTSRFTVLPRKVRDVPEGLRLGGGFRRVLSFYVSFLMKPVLLERILRFDLVKDGPIRSLTITWRDSVLKIKVWLYYCEWSSCQH